MADGRLTLAQIDKAGRALKAASQTDYVLVPIEAALAMAELLPPCERARVRFNLTGKAT